MSAPSHPELTRRRSPATASPLAAGVSITGTTAASNEAQAGGSEGQPYLDGKLYVYDHPKSRHSAGPLVRAATIKSAAWRCGGNSTCRADALATTVSLLEQAAAAGAAIASLQEEHFGECDGCEEPIDGPSVAAVAAVAAKHK